MSMVVRDARGFTHYYEEIATTPDSVRDAFDLMVRASPGASRSLSLSDLTDSPTPDTTRSI
ncbi:hypothetical protein [Microbacterium sp. Leaf320]|uniref:hypothetical protein n=1 Tax=Microbacterium sp. Leaf320 TaxID=1736334 RepID=UPI0006F6FEF3|nr:hypothetical protein [Microbacterium sp. Leaf320]KQQ65349.1 hypothetical protein ASF63_15525 [Microbacterium sp. Leaf320]